MSCSGDKKIIKTFVDFLQDYKRCDFNWEYFFGNKENLCKIIELIYKGNHISNVLNKFIWLKVMILNLILPHNIELIFPIQGGVKNGY